MLMKDVLKQELVEFQMISTNKREAIVELAQKLYEQGYITDLDVYIEAVMAREAIASTGLGMGLAIPHGKSSAVKMPCVAFGRSDKGIEYAADDSQPVYLLFLIAVPESSGDEHLRILANISRKLIHASVREKLKCASTVREVYDALE